MAELAWSAVGARFNQRRWEDAWSTLRQLDPPVTRQDAMVWLTLAARRPWTASTARAALGLVDRFEEDADLGAAGVAQLDPPLNLDHCLPSPARARVTELRRSLPRR